MTAPAIPDAPAATHEGRRSALAKTAAKATASASRIALDDPNCCQTRRTIAAEPATTAMRRDVAVGCEVGDGGAAIEDQICGTARSYSIVSALIRMGR